VTAAAAAAVAVVITLQLFLCFKYRKKGRRLKKRERGKKIKVVCLNQKFKFFIYNQKLETSSEKFFSTIATLHREMLWIVGCIHAVVFSIAAAAIIYRVKIAYQAQHSE
jgi:hypothetical protein